TTSNTATGDASGVGLALAAVVVAGGVALVTKKSK
ncbi:MAG: NPXTG-anchored protein, partial [Oscillospiraceae bacterium]|nr:NPXTG-anchored protein [Oscillospiraceae bacterium]